MCRLRCCACGQSRRDRTIRRVLFLAHEKKPRFAEADSLLIEARIAHTTLYGLFEKLFDQSIRIAPVGGSRLVGGKTITYVN